MKALLIILLMVPSLSFAKAKKKKVWKKRKIAQTSYSENNLNDEFRSLRNQIIGGQDKQGNNVAEIKTADELDTFIQKMDTGYDDLTDPSAKLLAAQMAFMKVYRGIIFRAKGLVADYKFVESGIVTGLRFTGQATQIYLPTDQWSAGFNYLIEPFTFDASSQAITIDDDATFKVFIGKELLPALTQFETRVAGINFSEIVWDNKVFYRDADFSSNQDRFVGLGEAEKKALLSVIKSSKSASNGLLAYKLTGLFNAINKIAKAYGINAVFDSETSLASKRAKIVRDQKELFTLIKTDGLGAKHLGEAYADMVSSVELAQEALDLGESRGDSSNTSNLLNFAGINAFSRINGNIMTNVNNIVLPGKTGRISSAVAGNESVSVNLQAMFLTNPPEDLKVFLPIFTRRADRQPTHLSKNGVRYTNFLHGKPNNWSEAEFAKYFPDVKNDADIKKTVRVISQSYGGAGIGLPLSLVMF